MKRLNQDEKTQIVGRYNLGETVIDLARLEGVSENSIYNWINLSKKKEVENTSGAQFFEPKYEPVDGKVTVNGETVQLEGNNRLKFNTKYLPSEENTRVNENKINLGSGCFPVDNTISIDNSLAGRNSKFFVICNDILKKRKYTKWEKKVIRIVWS